MSDPATVPSTPPDTTPTKFDDVDPDSKTDPNGTPVENPSG